MQTKEAEETFFKQQKKIDELELQLQEAEGIIVDLRAELKLATDELEKVKSNQMQNLNNGASNGIVSVPKSTADGGRSINTMDPIVPYPSDSETTNSDTETPVNDVFRDHNSYSITEPGEHAAAPDLGKASTEDSNVASTAMISKEHEHCRNGSTQRIRASEGNLENVPSDSSGDTAHRSSGDKVMEVTKKSRRRKTRGRTKTSRHMNSSSRTSVLNGGTYLVNGNLGSSEDGRNESARKTDNSPLGKGPLEMRERLLQKEISSQDGVQITHKRKRKQNARSRMGVFNSFSSTKSSLLSPCITYSVSNNSKCTGEKSASENVSEKQPLSDMDPELPSKNSQEGSGSENVDKSVKLLNKETEVTDVSVLVRQSHDAAKSTEHCSSGLDPTIDDVKVMSDAINHLSHFEDIKGSPTQADKNRLLKFTFHRKRKRESASSLSENTSSEPSTTKRRVTENEKDESLMEDSNLFNESPRDSRRVAQVARQVS